MRSRDEDEPLWVQHEDDAATFESFILAWRSEALGRLNRTVSKEISVNAWAACVTEEDQDSRYIRKLQEDPWGFERRSGPNSVLVDTANRFRPGSNCRVCLGGRGDGKRADRDSLRPPYPRQEPYDGRRRHSRRRCRATGLARVFICRAQRFVRQAPALVR